MCGIITLFEKIDENNLSLWDKLSHRGTDSYGYASWDGKRISIKKDLTPRRLKGKYKWSILHNRKASVGKITKTLAHPIEIDDKYYIIQNGTKKEIYYTHRLALSDTHGIGLIYKELKHKFKIFNYLDDTGVVFVIDKELKFIFFHKDESRSLYVNIDKKMLASEPIIEGTWQEINEENYIFTFDEFNFDNFIKTVELNKKKINIGKNELFKTLCDNCYKMKLCRRVNGRDICPDCEYTGKNPVVKVYNHSVYGGWKW